MEKEYEIRELEVDGKNLFRAWLGKLSKARQARVDSRLARVRSGNLGDHKSLGEGVYELRLYGVGLRIYFGWEGQTIMILICGGDKDSQKHDVKRAKALWKKYQENK